jgi:hypothetical protein
MMAEHRTKHVGNNEINKYAIIIKYRKFSADERGGGVCGINYCGPPHPEGVPEPQYIPYVFVFVGTIIVC